MVLNVARHLQNKAPSGGGGGGTGQWYLYQNFGTNSFVDDGTHGTAVDTTAYPNALSYSHSSDGVPNSSHLGWTEIYSTIGGQYTGRAYFTLAEYFQYYGGGTDLLGYSFDVSSFQKIKVKFHTGFIYGGSQNALRALNGSTLLYEEIFGDGVNIEKEYDTSQATTFEIIEGWNQTIGIFSLHWILAYY